jgi:hypothetical protein
VDGFSAGAHPPLRRICVSVLLDPPWTEVFDDDASAAIWLFAGRSNAPADFDGWLVWMQRLDRATACRPAVGM